MEVEVIVGVVMEVDAVEIAAAEGVKMRETGVEDG